MHTAVEEKRQPWMKWFWRDWRSDPNLRRCSLAARGLWAEMLGIMYFAMPYGHLAVNGAPMPLDALALDVGRPLKEVKPAFDELGIQRVYSLTEAAIVYSRRMVRDARRSHIARRNGARGGNPVLKSSDNQNWGNLDNQNPRESVNQIVGSTPEARSQIPLPPAGVVGDEVLDVQARQLLERYVVLYSRVRNGAQYAPKLPRDLHYAAELLCHWPDVERLLAMAEVFLRRGDIGPKNTPGTLGQFRHMAPDCDALLRENRR